jgi:hypothetical protein
MFMVSCSTRALFADEVVRNPRARMSIPCELCQMRRVARVASALDATMAARWRRFQLGEDQAQLPNGVFGAQIGPRRAHGEPSAHKSFGIRFGRTFTSEYHERAVELGCSLIPIVLPVASFYRADHALLLWVRLPLSVDRDLLCPTAR